MKRCGQKEHSKRGEKQNKFIFITKHAIIHLKYCYGSILLVSPVCMCVCVCVCVSNTTRTTERVNNESVLLRLITYF